VAQPIRLAVLAASPMYYHAAHYRAVAAHPALDLTAIFASSEGLRPHDAGYAQPIVWDVPATGGYRHTFLRRADANEIGGGFMSLHDWDAVGAVVRGRYDVLWLHGYNFLTHQLAATTQRLLGLPLLVREEQTLLHPRPPLKAFAKFLALRLFLTQARALYVGTENRRWFERYGVPRERLHFTPYCVDNERLARAATELKPERTKLRESFGIARDGGPVVLTVARLILKKQPLALLDAFDRLRCDTNCTLLLVGSGSLEDEVRRKAEKIPGVVVAGFLNQSEIVKAYACADVFTLFSARDETWGLAVNEAMNFGLPVVASDKVGCASDLVREDVNGFVVDHRDPAALAGRLGSLVSSPELRERMGAASRDAIREWSVDASLAGVVDAVRASVGAERWRAATALAS
jgi:glycosyltransferase involved in cell wall biosynthesis